MPKGIRHTVSDDTIVAEYRQGKFIAQICRDHSVGAARVRAVIDPLGWTRPEVPA